MAVLVRTLRSIVRNDAMRRDPDEIYGWRVFALVCASCFGGMLFGWDIGAIGGVLAMRPVQERFGALHRSRLAKADLDQNIVSTLQAGCFAACLVTSWLADRHGRRRCLMATGALATAGVVMQAASAARGTLALMYAGRFVAGLGVGAASSLTPVYVSECAPRAIRGGLTSFYQLFIVMGIMVAFWVNYGCLLHVPAPAVYVVPLSLQALPAVPRWCARQDDWEQATEILVNLRSWGMRRGPSSSHGQLTAGRLPADSDYVATELREMADQLDAERRLTGDATAVTLLKEMALVPGNRNRAIISAVLMICQQLTGVNSINYYAPQIFQNLGMDGTATSLFATGVYGVAKTVACAAFLLFVADSLGRRWSLLWTSAAQAIVLFIIGTYGRVRPPVAGQPVTAFGYVAIACIYLEIPTARLRAMNVALAAAVQWLFNFVMARTVLTMQSTMGKAGYGMFYLFGAFDIAMGVFVWFCVPENKGLSLEKMDELFGVTALVGKDPEPGQSGEEGAAQLSTQLPTKGT